MRLDSGITPVKGTHLRYAYATPQILSVFSVTYSRKVFRILKTLFSPVLHSVACSTNTRPPVLTDLRSHFPFNPHWPRRGTGGKKTQLLYSFPPISLFLLIPLKSPLIFSLIVSPLRVSYIGRNCFQRVPIPKIIGLMPSQVVWGVSVYTPILFQSSTCITTEKVLEGIGSLSCLFVLT